MKKQFYFFFLFWLLAHHMAAQDCSSLQFTFTSTESRCMATGSISVQATGGSGSYNYKVTGPVTKAFTSSSQITGLQAGYYQVTVKDVNTGCTVVQDSVHVPGTYQDPRFQLDKINVSCAGNDGSISVISQQYGRQPFSYSIIAPSPSGVGTTSATGSFSGLSAGEYFVQLTDSCGGIQVRRITIESYSWWFDTVSVVKVGCDSADVFIRLRDNRGNLNTGGGFSGFSYGIVNSPGDTSWFSANSFRVFIGTKRSLTVVARDACGNVFSTVWYLAANKKPSISSVSYSSYGCTTFSATVTGQQNLTNPRFCLVRGPGDTLSCNSTGVFTNIPYGTYCITVKDPCYDTTMQRCFTVNKPVPAVGASVSISAQNCTTFTATITGQQNLTNPNYCIYNASNVQVACNSTGVFTNLPYGSYCIRVANGCSDTTITRCFTVTRPVPVVSPPVISNTTCSTFTVNSSGTNIFGPANYCLYDSQGNLIGCNGTGNFPNLGYGSYCVRAITACGDTTAPACFSTTPPRPAVGANVQVSNLACNNFTASITGQQNLTTPQYCLYNGANTTLLQCNSTGVFTNLAYGSYCIRVINNSCYDTIITRCFTQARPQPAVNATMQISNQGCSTFSARVTGSNLTSPTYCLYDSQDNFIACNSTGIFDNLPYGGYCMVVNDGCIDTTFRICQTVGVSGKISMATSKACTIGNANVSVQFDSPNPPYQVRVYHPSGALVHSATSSSASVFMLLPYLPAGQKYKVVGEDNCGRKDSGMLAPDASVVTKSVSVRPKCPTAAWLNGSGDLAVTCSSNWYAVLPAVIKKNSAAFSKSFSSQSGSTYTISDLEPATYVVEYTLQTCNTKLYDTVTIAPYTYPTQGQSAIYQCDNNSFSLGADVAGGIGPYTYQIIGSIPQTPSIISAQQNTAVFTINNGTVYSLVRLRSIDACGNATLNDVSVLPLQNIAVTASSTCFFQDITLTVDTIPNATYVWYRKTSPTDSVEIGSGLTYNLPFFRPEEVGTYVCKVSVNNGCLTRLAQFTLDGNCGQVVLPLSWSLGGKSVPEGSRLTWNVREEKDVAHYEVERRTEGQFAPVGKITARSTGASAVYQFIDHHPAQGLNLYRVKMVLAGGRVEYSNTVSIKHSGSSVQVFPNPVHDLLNIRVAGPRAADYRVEIWTASGQMTEAREWKHVQSVSFTYNRKKLPSGMYFVKVKNLSAGVEEIRKVILE
ncbi:MAG TPA: T9SS type A sorting domain-containing protein [Flavisolibacter sp.]